ncbi:MAG: PAS domain S-box protein [bacterium]
MAKKAERLQELEQRYKILVENIGEGLVIYDKNMVVTFVNDKICKIVGYKKDEVIGTQVSWFFTGENKDKVEIELRGRRRGKSSHYSVRLKTKKGKEILLFVSGVPLFDKNRKFDGGVAVVSDITERKQLEDKLEERKMELEKEVKKRTNLLVDLYRGVAVTEERNRLAQEIHDFYAQTLVSSILKIDLCEKVLDKGPENLKRELKELKKMLRKSIKSTRNVILRLRIPDFHRMGFVTILRQYLEEFRRKTGIAASLDLRVEKSLPMKIQVGTYRIIREAMNNVKKHARAKNVELSLRTHKNRNLRLIIEDDGKGFDLKRAIAKSYSKHFGLLGMEEQARLLGGSFAVESAKRQGTKIKVKVPLERQDG